LSLKYLLDAAVVSAAVMKVPNARVVDLLEERSAQCAIGAPVWHELTFGCRRLPRGRRRTAIEHYLSDVVHATFPILPYDEAAAAWHALERARLEKAGKPAPFADGEIAAIAATNDLILVTPNTKDFRGYTRLELQDWSDA
jgi:tRNA(fMet)-specific endonuclease VapC